MNLVTLVVRATTTGIRFYPDPDTPAPLLFEAKARMPMHSRYLLAFGFPANGRALIPATVCSNTETTKASDRGSCAIRRLTNKGPKSMSANCAALVVGGSCFCRIAALTASRISFERGDEIRSKNDSRRAAFS